MAAAEPVQVAAGECASLNPALKDFAPGLMSWRKEIATLTKTEQDWCQRCRLQRFAV
jgi:phage host-nuclease inhibitor protein Gam